MSGRIEQEIGTKWAGRLPDSWGVFKLKYLASIRNSSVDKKSEEGETPIRLCNYVDVYYNDRITADLDFMEATASQAEIARFRLRRGDVIITKDSESPDDIAVPAYVTRDFNDVLCGYHLALLRPDPSRVDGRFLAYCFRALDVNLQFQVGANGITRYGLSLDVLGNALIPVPPIDVQWAIADFLDRKTAAIDEVIRKKERLIGLLEEKRQAVITQAVTKGLDASVPMKDSGVEWLGEVPAHWEVKKTKFVARLESGHTPSRQRPEYWENCTIPWFTLADVWQIRDGRAEYLGETVERVSELGLANSSARLLPTGTVVLSRTASVGFSGIMPCPMATSQDFVNWVCGPKILPEYLLCVFRSMKNEFRRLTMGSTHKTIYMPDVEEFRTPVPPIDEQKQIVGEVRRRLRVIDGAGDRLGRQIAALREYRQTLISHAVTGKIDVREAVPA